MCCSPKFVLQDQQQYASVTLSNSAGVDVPGDVQATQYSEIKHSISDGPPMATSAGIYKAVL